MSRHYDDDDEMHKMSRHYEHDDIRKIRQMERDDMQTMRHFESETKRDLCLCDICHTYLPSIDELQVHLLTDHYENEDAKKMLGIEH